MDNKYLAKALRYVWQKGKWWLFLSVTLSVVILLFPVSHLMGVKGTDQRGHTVYSKQHEGIRTFALVVGWTIHAEYSIISS